MLELRVAERTGYVSLSDIFRSSTHVQPPCRTYSYFPRELGLRNSHLLALKELPLLSAIPLYAFLSDPRFMTTGYRQIYDELPVSHKVEVDRIRASYKAGKSDLQQNAVTQTAQDFMGVTMPPRHDLPYYPQEQRTTCQISCFRMALAASVGLTPAETEVLEQADTVNAVSSSEIMPISIDKLKLWNAFNSPHLRTSAQFLFGLHPQDLTSYLDGVVARGKKPILAASVASEVRPEGLHQVVITGMTSTEVIVHDPSTATRDGVTIGGAHRRVPKDNFYERWSRSNFSMVSVEY